MLPNGRLISGNKKADQWKVVTQNRAELLGRSCNVVAQRDPSLYYQRKTYQE